MHSERGLAEFPKLTADQRQAISKRGTHRHIRKILPITKKKEHTPSIDEESKWWAYVAGGGEAYMPETDSDESDDVPELEFTVCLSI